MLVYLIWEQESYHDYDMVKIFDSREKAEAWVGLNADPDLDYRIEEKEVC
ncbi:MAG: hypothetical protein HF308_14390 [Ignavibacteria bacterium]|jgi:hypothetical protein|nr:hypothetical protein [Ignavibacteria bacterium]